MQDGTADQALSLQQLYDLTIDLFEDEERITRALDWVDQVLPAFAGACRNEVQHGSGEPIARWLEWTQGPSAQVVEEAGKGEVYDWRLGWVETLLRVTLTLMQDESWKDMQRRSAVGQNWWIEHESGPSCFPLAYWLDLIEYLSSPPPAVEIDARHTVLFPLVLSEPIVDSGTETNVILAQFLLEPVARATGEVFLHPEQTVVRCMDAVFADSFRYAARAAKHELDRPLDQLPGVRVRVQTVKPSHERFLCGVMLRGESGGGALAVGLRHIYTGVPGSDDQTAISFALHHARNMPVDGKCHPVGGTDEKVRGCAKQNLARLLVAKQQQAPLAIYGRKNDLQIVGASTVREAAAMTQASVPVPTVTATPRKIVVLYQRKADQDRYVVRLLEDNLGARGHSVFIDRHIEIGIQWAQEIDQRIREADVVIALMSPTSVVSDMLASELQTADEARQRHGESPRIFPVRVGYDGPLPERIAYILDPLQHAVWSGPFDDASLVDHIERSLERPDPEMRQLEQVTPEPLQVFVAAPAATGASQSIIAGANRSDLEPFDGLVPLNSRYYIERSIDAEFHQAVDQRHSVILAKGARQMGKSSLLARGLHRSEKDGARTILTDFQKLSMEDLHSIKAFYLALGRMVARQLKIGIALDDVWVDRRSPNLNFEEYVEDHVLPCSSQLVWAMDEVDKLFFATDYSSDVFGLFRSWANERQGRTSSPWAGVSMIIAYATEAHLFITDINQSPFNVGTRFEMPDFTLDQIAELNRRYDCPIRSDSELQNFYRLVGGHPYLVRRGLYAIVTERIDVKTFETEAVRDNGPLGDHLRRILTLLARNEDNLAALKEILKGKTCSNFEAFYHLRSAGIIVGESIQHATVRCHLYKSYLSRYLL